VTAGTRIAQAGTALVTGKETNDRTISTNLPGLGRFDVKPMTSKKQAAGEFAQVASLAIKNPIISGATSGLATGLENDLSVKDTLKQTGTGALYGLGSQLFSKGVSKALKPAAKPVQESAEASMSKALGPTTKVNKELTQKVVPGLIERRTTALTRGGLLNKATKATEEAGEALEAGYEKLPPNAQLQWGSVLKRLSEAKSRYVIDGEVLDKEAHTALDQVQKDLLNVAKGKDTILVASARKARQILDSATKRSSKTFGLTGNETAKVAAQKEAANAIRSELAKEFPEIDKLNKEFSFWNNVKKVVGETVQRTKSQSSLSQELAGDTGAIVGATMKGTIGSIAISALTLKFLKQAVQSTGWRTTSAMTKASLANFLAKGDFVKADSLLQKIMSANQSQKMQKK
jgi:hypothetical protein